MADVNLQQGILHRPECFKFSSDMKLNGYLESTAKYTAMIVGSLR